MSFSIRRVTQCNMKRDTLDFDGKTIMRSDIVHFGYPDQCKILSICGNAIQYLKSPTKEQQMIAVMQNGYAIRHIKHPTYELQKAAILQQPTSVQFIKNPPQELLDEAFSKDAHVLQYIKHPSYEQMKSAVMRKGATIGFIENPSDELVRLAIEQNPMAIGHIKNLDTKLLLHAIRKMPKSAKNLMNKIPREIVIEALRLKGGLIKYVKNPDQTMINIALSNMPEAIQFIESPTEEQQIYAIQKNPKLLKILSNPSEKVILEAIKVFPEIIMGIENITPILYNTYNKEMLKRYKSAKREYCKYGIEPSFHIKIIKKYKRMFQETINNNQTCTVINKYNERLADILLVLSELINPTSISIASGFLYKSGLSMINPIIETTIKNGGRVDLIIGSMQKYYECLALNKMMDGIDYETGQYLKKLLEKDYIKLATYEHRFFHGKYYMIKGSIYTAVIIGSSNVSYSGLMNNSELNTVLLCPSTDAHLYQYNAWFEEFFKSCSIISSINLKLFKERVSERDSDIESVVYGKNVSIKTFSNRIQALSDSEIKHRLSMWMAYRPSRIIEDVKICPFEGYVLLEFLDRKLYVFESLIPNNAFYCFKEPSIENLKSLLIGKSKTQIYKEKIMVKRGYHMSRSHFDLYISSIFDIDS